MIHLKYSSVQGNCVAMDVISLNAGKGVQLSMF